MQRPFSGAESVRLACHAMATRFELLLEGADPVALRAAGEEAIEEILRVESLLSAFLDRSPVSELNRRASHAPVAMPPELFALLERSVRLSQQSFGAFDITVRPLIELWRTAGDTGTAPGSDAIRETLQRVGSGRVDLDPERRTVRFGVPGMAVDFGAFGKGYALDRAASLLREAGVTSALIHGGSSSMLGIGPLPENPAWRIGLPGVTHAEELNVIELRDSALSFSGGWGRRMTDAQSGRQFGHIIDPRTGSAVEVEGWAAVQGSDCADSDALSTAWMLLNHMERDDLRRSFLALRFHSGRISV